MTTNKLMIAAAGSGKTSFLVNEARKIKDKRVLVTTYTEANQEEIRRKFGGRIPENVTIQTWFSFLLEHGVRPFQSAMNDDLHDVRIGFYLTEKQSGLRYYMRGKPVYWGQDDFLKYYFTNDFKIYSDKVSKFIIECNKETGGAVIDRMCRAFPYIFIDEVQDLAGWELELLKLMFKSNSNILLVGDPRQVTYLTHHSTKFSKYKNGKIKEFIGKECKSQTTLCEIDENTLQFSHRNNKSICEFSSSLYPEYTPCRPCECKECRSDNVEHQGVFAVKSEYVEEYCAKFQPQILRYSNSVCPDLNFGQSKGSGFERVLIYPTDKIRKYLLTGSLKDIDTIRAKFYVALTRAKSSVAIVYDFKGNTKFIDGIIKYSD